MLDLSRFESECPELVTEVKKLRKAGEHLLEVARMVTAQSEPVNKDCFKWEHVDQKMAADAIAQWNEL